MTGNPDAPPAPRYEGILQGIGSGMVLGWAADRGDPEARVLVALVVDGELVADGVADVPRPDLAEMNLGDGAHGFLIALPQHLQRPARHSILALAGPERTPIPAAPSFWQEPATDGAWSDVVFAPGGALSAAVPPPPERAQAQAIVEPGGWLYSFNEEGGREAGDEGVQQVLVEMLSANAQRCAELGIAYVPALVPRKRDVLAGSGEDSRGWVAKVVAELRDVDYVELLDLLGALRDARRHGSPYHRTDADWNDRGAFFVARALMKEAHRREPALRPPALADLHLLTVPAYRGTLADLPLLERGAEGLVRSERAVESETGLVVDPSPLQAMRMPVEQHLARAAPTHLRVYARPECDEQARLAVVGDAAALSLIPWLAERTSRTTFFWATDLPMVQLELELPRVVFHLIRETDPLGESAVEESSAADSLPVI